jgi:allantoate deiminase
LQLVDGEGVSLAQAIADFGLDVGKLDDAGMSDEVMGFLEIHIEQGPVLEAEGLAVATVSGIVGQTRCELIFDGQANHAGTTPMGLRRDAMAAAAEWIVQIEGRAREAEGLVATVGKISTEPNAGNVIAGKVTVSLDVRHARDSIREQAVTWMLERAQAIATKRELRCTARRLMEQAAIPMDEELTALLTESLELAGFPTRTMPSGAGHDAMVMATRVPTAMLFLRSPGGLSHHPDEAVLEEDVEAALTVAGLFLRRMAAKVG